MAGASFHDFQNRQAENNYNLYNDDGHFTQANMVPKFCLRFALRSYPLSWTENVVLVHVVNSADPIAEKTALGYSHTNIFPSIRQHKTTHHNI